MKEEAQLVALMEWLGWTEIENSGLLVFPYSGHPPGPRIICAPKLQLPPLTLDLMHEAETKLTDDQYRTFHYNLVQLHNESCMPVCRCHSAKAPKRLEALLKTISEWNE